MSLSGRAFRHTSFTQRKYYVVVTSEGARLAETKKRWKVYCLGRLLWCKRNPVKGGPDSSCSCGGEEIKTDKKPWRSRAKIPWLCNGAVGRSCAPQECEAEWPMMGLRSWLGIEPTQYKHAHPRVYLHGLNIDLFIFCTDMASSENNQPTGPLYPPEMWTTVAVKRNVEIVNQCYFFLIILKVILSHFNFISRTICCFIFSFFLFPLSRNTSLARTPSKQTNGESTPGGCFPSSYSEGFCLLGNVWIWRL